MNEKYLHGKIPTLERLRRAPELRRVLAEAGHGLVPHRGVTVPTLNVAGWWDQEDFYGPLKIYETLEPHDSGEDELPRRRALEPRRLDADRRRPPRAGSSSAADTSKYFREKIQAPWFAY